MAQFLIVDNAIAWAHFRLRGGWPSVLGMSGAVALLAVIGLLITPQLFPGPGSPVYLIWRNGLLGFELLLMLMMAPSRAGSAVRADVTNRVIESHRLMPISAAEAVAGYLIGPNSGILALTAATVALGAYATGATGIPVYNFLIASFLVISFGIMLAVVTTFFSFRYRTGGGGVLFAMALPFFVTKGYLGDAIPAFTVFSAPFIRKTVFSMQVGTDLGWPYEISELAQLALGGLFFIAACRKYRRDDQLGFTPFMGLGLLATWIAASAVGIGYWATFRWHTYRFSEVSASTQAIVASLIGLLLALLPVSATARLEAAWNYRHRLHPSSAGRRPFRGWLMVLISGGMILLLMRKATFFDTINAPLARVMLVLFLVIAAFLFSMYFLLRILYRTSGISSILAFWVLLTWATPPLLALIPSALSDTRIEYDSGASGLICAFSPPGAMVELARSPQANVIPGVAFQMLVAIAAAILFQYSASRARTQKDPPADPDQPRTRSESGVKLQS